MKGVGIFKNVDTIVISAYSTGKKDAKYGFKNFDELYKLKNVEKIYIGECNDSSKYDFSQFPKLKILTLNRVYGVNGLNLGESGTLEEITLMGVKGKAKLDISGQQNISRFDISHIELRSINFGNNSKINDIDIINLQGIKQIDISGLKNLTSFRFSNAKDLEKLEIGRLEKLKALTVVDCKKVKNIDVSKCINLKKLFITSTAISKLKISSKHKLKTLSVYRCNKLKNLKLNNNYIKYLYIEKCGIKQIDVRKMKNLKRIRIDRSQKVIGKTEAKIRYIN